jgi:phosphate transport system protein
MLTMARETFNYELERVEADVLALGHRAQRAILDSVEALCRQDLLLARRIIQDDFYVNARRYEIENECLRLIAMQQPMARDLRLLSTFLAIATELERIHDYAKGISKITLLLGGEPLLLKPLVDLPMMAEKGQDMLRRAMLALARRDVAMARGIPPEDDVVDELYNEVYRAVFTAVLADPTQMAQGSYLLWAGHNLERTADRVTNICERVVFTVTGQMVELDTHDDINLELVAPFPAQLNARPH